MGGGAHAGALSLCAQKRLAAGGGGGGGRCGGPREARLSTGGCGSGGAWPSDARGRWERDFNL